MKYGCLACFNLVLDGAWLPVFVDREFVFCLCSGSQTNQYFVQIYSGFDVYGFLTFGIGFLAGITLFIGAHSNPVGSILGTQELICGSILLLMYLAAAWLMCSFIVGSLIWPNWASERFNKE